MEQKIRRIAFSANQLFKLNITVHIPTLFRTSQKRIFIFFFNFNNFSIKSNKEKD